MRNDGQFHYPIQRIVFYVMCIGQIEIEKKWNWYIF